MNNEEMTEAIVSEIIEEEELTEEEFVDLEGKESEKKPDTTDGIIAWCDKHRKGVNRATKILKGVGIGVAAAATAGVGVFIAKAVGKRKAEVIGEAEEIESWSSEVPEIEISESADVESDVQITEF